MASSVKMTRDLKQDMEQGHLPISDPVFGSPKRLSDLESPIPGGNDNNLCFNVRHLLLYET